MLKPVSPDARLHPLEGPAYVQYQYGYPHKTAYRALGEPRPLREAWRGEDRGALLLYLHVPFCEMRCGFCNLFTAAQPLEAVMERFVEALEREAAAVREALGPATFSRVTLGGGTPSFLPLPLFRRVVDVAERTFGARLHDVPFCVEVSPETATADLVACLVERGVDRVSIGVQSFRDEETRALARPQSARTVSAALDRLREAPGVTTLNLDLIYGIEGQTPASWRESLRAALRWKPEELYLYPLYVRPKTFLGKGTRAWDDFRLELYRVGRDLLLGEGYRQVSMRCFRRGDAPAQEGPAYSCQDDGTVGLGVGARSYTRALHYSSEWAVSPKAVRGLIDAYCERPSGAFALAHHGIALNEEEQRRRHLILSLLAEGLDASAYAARFGRDARADFPELEDLVRWALVEETGRGWRLTASGLERSDAVGPWLQSQAVSARMAEYETR